MVVIILNEQQEQQPKRGKYNSLFYFLEIRSSKFLIPAVQDLYVFVHQINFIFWQLRMLPFLFIILPCFTKLVSRAFTLGTRLALHWPMEINTWAPEINYYISS